LLPMAGPRLLSRVRGSWLRCGFLPSSSSSSSSSFSSSALGATGCQLVPSPVAGGSGGRLSVGLCGPWGHVSSLVVFGRTFASSSDSDSDSSESSSSPPFFKANPKITSSNIAEKLPQTMQALEEFKQHEADVAAQLNLDPKEPTGQHNHKKREQLRRKAYLELYRRTRKAREAAYETAKLEQTEYPTPESLLLPKEDMPRNLRTPPAAYATLPLGRPGKLADLFDTHRTAPTDPYMYGHAWLAKDLRLKSFGDLHKLWFVLLRERHTLDTEYRALQQQRKPLEPRKPMPAPERWQRVKRSMNRIKQVLSERAGELRHRGNVALADELDKVINQN